MKSALNKLANSYLIYICLAAVVIARMTLLVSLKSEYY